MRSNEQDDRRKGSLKPKYEEATKASCGESCADNWIEDSPSGKRGSTNIITKY